MTFIDWSDPEGLLELLSEFVRDETDECTDGDRKLFLADLLARINDLVEESSDARVATNRLRIIHNSMDEKFLDDPVSVHIRDCIEELDHFI